MVADRQAENKRGYDTGGSEEKNSVAKRSVSVLVSQPIG